MVLPVVYRHRVKHDLASAHNWYETQRAGLGNEFPAAVEAAFESIGINPTRFAAVHGGVRRVIVMRFPFAVFYLIEPTRVVVLRVLHTARDPRLWPKTR